MLSILHRRLFVEGVALKWFHSHLTGNSQTFSVGDSKSDCHRVRCGVPKDQCSGLWNSWPTLRTLLIYSIGTRSTTTCTLTINKSTCTPNQAWRPHAWRVWPPASQKYVTGAHLDDYSLMPWKRSQSGLARDQRFVVFPVINTRLAQLTIGNLRQYNIWSYVGPTSCASNNCFSDSVTEVVHRVDLKNQLFTNKVKLRAKNWRAEGVRKGI